MFVTNILFLTTRTSMSIFTYADISFRYQSINFCVFFYLNNKYFQIFYNSFFNFRNANVLLLNEFSVLGNLYTGDRQRSI